MTDRTDALEQELHKDRAHLRETIDRLERRLDPSDWIGAAAQSFAGNSKNMAQHLGRDMRDQPLAALTTAVGLAWLMGSSGRKDPYQRDFQVTGTAEELSAHRNYEDYELATRETVRTDDETDELYNRRLTDNCGRALRLERYPDEDDQSFSDRVKQAADHAKTRSSAFRQRIRDGAHSAGSSVADGYSHSKDKVASASKNAVEYFEENPLATGALGLALGALLGTAVPMSRKEYDTMKGAADAGVQAGSEAVASAAESVEEWSHDAKDNSEQIRPH